MEKYSCQTQYCYEATASRLKLFTRMLWAFLLVFVAWVYMLGFAIAYFLQWWYILILGKRHESLFKYMAKVQNWINRVNAWMQLLTDERPYFLSLGEPQFCNCGSCTKNEKDAMSNKPGPKGGIPSAPMGATNPELQNGAGGEQ